MLMSKAMKGYQSKAPSRAEAALEWLELHTREVFWGAIGVIVVAGSIWFYQKSQAAQARNASVALDEAEQAMNAGNVPLAQADFEKMMRRWPDTPSGKVAVILLAQVHYQRGEYQQGIDALKPLTTTDDPYFTSGAQALSASGLEQLKKYDDAAAMYRKAAEKAASETDRGSYLLSAARVLMLAGKEGEARAIWVRLASDPSGVAAPEARVRLGELSAKG
jgi:predicted negative regulator of RcsB-dependent stress response